MFRLMVMLFVLGMPLTALAQDASEAAPDGIEEMVQMLISAAKGGEWSVFASVLIMILVFLVTKVKFIKNWLPKEAKPWVAAVAGVLTSIAATVLSTGDWLQAILHGLVTGAAATGLWELIGKRFLKKDEE